MSLPDGRAPAPVPAGGASLKAALDSVKAADKALAYRKDLEEAWSPGLSPERMYEIVREAYREEGEDYNVADLLYNFVLAKTVLERPDCPIDLMLLVVTRPNPERFQNGFGLINTVLERPDCPDEIKVTYALNSGTFEWIENHG